MFLLILLGWPYLASTEVGSSSGSNYLLVGNPYLSILLVFYKLSLYWVMLLSIFILCATIFHQF